MILKHINKTNIFVKLQILDLDRIIRYNIVKFVKNKKKKVSILKYILKLQIFY